MTLSQDTFPTLKPRTPGILVNSLILGLILCLIPLQTLLNQNIDDYVMQIVNLIGLQIILAVSLNLINGITGQFSLGHMGFMAIGAYITGTIMHHYKPVGAPAEFALLGLLIVGGLAAAIVGLLVGIPSIRLKGDYLAIATLGFGEIICIVINSLENIGVFKIGSSSGLSGIPKLSGFFWIYTGVILCVGVVWRLAYSTKGLAFRAVRDDETAAGAMGIDATWHKAAAFAVGAFFAGVAGGLKATYEGRIDPKDFGFMQSVGVVVLVVLGGSGSITGSILIAILLTTLSEAFREFKEWRPFAYAALLILMMLLRPGGFFGNHEIKIPLRKLWGRLFKKREAAR